MTIATISRPVSDHNDILPESFHRPPHHRAIVVEHLAGPQRRLRLRLHDPDGRPHADKNRRRKPVSVRPDHPLRWNRDAAKPDTDSRPCDNLGRRNFDIPHRGSNCHPRQAPHRILGLRDGGPSRRGPVRLSQRTGPARDTRLRVFPQRTPDDFNSTTGRRVPELRG